MHDQRGLTARSVAGPFSLRRIGFPAVALGLIAALGCPPSDQLVRSAIVMDLVVLLVLTWIVRRLLRERLA